MNVPSTDQAVRADYCGSVSGHQDPDKPGTCGWSTAPSMRIASPLIAECPLNYECEVAQRIPLGRGAICLVEILETHVDESAMG